MQNISMSNKKKKIYSSVRNNDNGLTDRVEICSILLWKSGLSFIYIGQPHIYNATIKYN